MNRPRRFLTRMIVFLLIVAAVVGVLRDALVGAFMANPSLNGLILGVLLLGIAFAFRQVLGLSPEARWIEEFRADSPAAAPSPRRLRLLAPMARMLADRKGGRMMLSAPAMRSLLDGIGSRLDESRELSRYMIGLLIFLGLLGTFWGLLDTVGSVGAVIGGLNADSENLLGTFSTLKSNLEAPLAGMGTAFSSSLFGLAGSLVLGFLDLQAGQAQNQFYNDLEEWLSGVTHLSSGSAVADGDQSVPVYVQALLEKTADSLEDLQRTLARGEEDRRAANARATDLTEKLAALSDQMRVEQELIGKLAESQTDMQPVLRRLAEGGGADSGGVDEATRGHIRNLDVGMARLLDETVNGRAYLASELRSEIKLLGRMMAAASAAPPGAGHRPPPDPAPYPPPAAPSARPAAPPPAMPAARPFMPSPAPPPAMPVSQPQVRQPAPPAAAPPAARPVVQPPSRPASPPAPRPAPAPRPVPTPPRAPMAPPAAPRRRPRVAPEPPPPPAADAPPPPAPTPKPPLPGAPVPRHEPRLPEPGGAEPPARAPRVDMRPTPPFGRGRRP